MLRRGTCNCRNPLRRMVRTIFYQQVPFPLWRMFTSSLPLRPWSLKLPKLRLCHVLAPRYEELQVFEVGAAAIGQFSEGIGQSAVVGQTVSGMEPDTITGIGINDIVEIARAVSVEVVQANHLMIREMYTTEYVYFLCYNNFMNSQVLVHFGVVGFHAIGNLLHLF